MGLIITFIIVGLILIFAEILLVPGVGVVGVLGLLSMGGSCFYAFYEFGNTTGSIVTAVNGLLIVVFAIYALRAKTWKRMSLETNIDSKAIEDESAYVCVGDLGRSVTRMAPMGTVRFGDRIVEAKSLEGIIDPDIAVEVVLIEDGRIHVTPHFEEN